MKNLELIDFFKKNLKSIAVFSLLAFILGFAIGYYFFPQDNVIAVESITIDESPSTNPVQAHPKDNLKKQ